MEHSMDVVRHRPFMRSMIGLTFIGGLVGLTACATAPGAVTANCDAFPDGDVEFVVPYSAGGGFDTWARLIAPLLQEELANDVAVPVINREGAGGITGVTEVFGSAPDGQKIVLTEPGILATTMLSGQVDTDFSKLTALGQVTVGPEVVVVSGSSPWTSIADAQKAAADRQLLMGTGGLAAINIVAFDALGIPFTNVVHEGSSEAILSVIRGDTEITVFPLSSVAEGIRAGDLKPLVVVGTAPGDENPDADVVAGVPTLDDVTGQDGLGAALEQHRIIVAPPGVSQCVVDALDEAITTVFDDEELLSRAEQGGLVPVHLNAADSQDVLQNTIDTLAEYKDLLVSQLEG
jgi:tripartite-type tricarboxylate transporter receptor subunit TctC